MEQWNIWLDRDLWLNVAIVVVATALIYSVLRTLVSTLHKRLMAWSKEQDGSWPHFVAVVLGRTSRLLLLAFSLLLALRLPELPGSWQSVETTCFCWVATPKSWDAALLTCRRAGQGMPSALRTVTWPSRKVFRRPWLRPWSAWVGSTRSS